MTTRWILPIFKMSTELKRYNVEHRYSDAAVYNGVVYVAGQVPETTLDGDIAAQTARCSPPSTACWPPTAATRRAS